MAVYGRYSANKFRETLQSVNSPLIIPDTGVITSEAISSGIANSLSISTDELIYPLNVYMTTNANSGGTVDTSFDGGKTWVNWTPATLGASTSKSMQFLSSPGLIRFTVTSGSAIVGIT
jgi:hypothetical protein